MLKIMMRWVDDRTESTIVEKEPDVLESPRLEYGDWEEPTGSLPLDAFIKMLAGVGFSKRTIAKYLLDGALSCFADNVDEIDAVNTIKWSLSDYGYDDAVKEN